MINYSSIKISFIYIMLLVGVNNIALAQTQSSPEAPLQQEDFNFRTLNLFKWPSDTLISNEDPESANTLSAKKKIADNNCRKFQTQYSKDAKKALV